MCSFQGCAGKVVKKGFCSGHYKMQRVGLPLRPLRQYSTGSVEQRIAANSRPEGDCVVWTGDTQSNGYGRITVEGRKLTPHRARFIARNGSLPDGLEVHHKCHNRLCVKLDHLELKTRRQHLLDHNEERMRDSRGRFAAHAY